MKRLGLFLLAVVMVAGLAGCSGDHEADPVGTWAVTWDWSCDGKLIENAVWHIYPTGSFSDAGGSSGSWSLADKTITLAYTYNVHQEDDPGDYAIFVGEIDGAGMEGKMSVGPAATGCWSAHRTSTTP